jgi:hypothetical protein
MRKFSGFLPKATTLERPGRIPALCWRTGMSRKLQILVVRPQKAAFFYSPIAA